MERWRLAKVVVAVIAVLGLSACWPSPDHDPDRSSYNPGERTISQATVGKLVESWAAPLDDSGAGTPVLSSSGVHVVAGKSVYGFDIHTGARRWKSSALGELPDVWFVSASDDVFVRGGELMTSAGGPLIGSAWSTTFLDPRSGAFLRNDHTGGLVDSVREPNTAGSWEFLCTDCRPEISLVVGGEGGGRARLSYQWGAPTPRTTLGADAVYVSATSLVGPTHQVPTPSGPITVWDHFGPGVRAYPKAVYEGCTTQDLLQSEVTFACPTWVATLDGSIASAPVLSPDGTTLYVTTSGGNVYALDHTDGSVLWSAALGSTSYQPALAEGRLYVPTVSDGLQVFDAAGCGAATCSPTWMVADGGPTSIAGDVLYVGGSTIRAYPADGCGATTCAPLWSADTGGPAGKVVVSHGRVYASVSGRGLVSYRLAA
jgi:outer membrane protein assembly factor BamB